MSSVVEIPKVARKEQQSILKSVSATVSTPVNQQDKKPTPSKLVNPNKRTIGQLYGTNNNVPAKSAIIAPTKVSNNNEYTFLVNSINEILMKGESDLEIVTKIKALINNDSQR